MSVKININVEKPQINIIKDKEQEAKEINQIAEQVVKNILNHPELGEKANKIGTEKLMEMAKTYIVEYIKAEEEQQVNNALEITKSLNESLLKSLVDTATKLANNL